MRRACALAAQALLVAGPTALAFFTGGFFDEPRAWAGVGGAAALLLAALGHGSLPRGRGPWLGLAGAGLLAAWTLASIAWAPVAGDAYHAGQIAVLYAVGLLAGAVAFDRRGARLAELGLATGTLLVLGYALSERFLPGLLQFARSTGADGRLEQPLTYWNATGELAALGLVLFTRIAGDATRARWLRAGAAAAVVPEATALYVSFSRGALFAVVAGLVALLAIAPRREAWTATGRAAGFAVLGALAAAPFHGFTAMSGSRAAQEFQGAVVLAVIVVLAGLAATLALVAARRETTGELALPARSGLAAGALIAAGLALAIVVGAHESTARHLSGGAGRLTTLQSNRYAYWSVAWRAFEHEPLRGVGAAGWRVWWLRYRTVPEGAQDAHSLPMQTLAELGAVGVVLLAALLAGLWLAARRALSAGAEAAGAVAGLVTYVAHAPLDWDWQMPALTGVAIVLGGIVLALAGGAPVTAPRRSVAPRA